MIVFGNVTNDIKYYWDNLDNLDNLVLTLEFKPFRLFPPSVANSGRQGYLEDGIVAK